MSESKAVSIFPEMTPNPQSTRFALDRVLIAGPGYDFPNAAVAAHSPLAEAIFSIPGVTGVFIGPNFVTVTIGDEAQIDWQDRTMQTIKNFVTAGHPVMRETLPPTASGHGKEPETEIERQIVRILDAEIRPAVAMDGGDIVFYGFESGVVRLRLKGSCHGCPSSLVTLKMGIEQRLKMQIPEVEAVEAVN